MADEGVVLFGFVYAVVLYCCSCLLAYGCFISRSTLFPRASGEVVVHFSSHSGHTAYLEETPQRFILSRSTLFHSASGEVVVHSLLRGDAICLCKLLGEVYLIPNKKQELLFSSWDKRHGH